MVVIEDAMIVIHLAKLSILEKSCDYFKKVLIPEGVHQEIIKGKERGFPEVPIIIELAKNKRISIKKVMDKKLIEKANKFSIQKGEAEVVALYWQENADLIATDDDNVRRKKVLLGIDIVGTPAIVIGLHKSRMISKDKAKQAISELRKIGWFSNEVLDKMSMEVENG